MPKFRCRHARIIKEGEDDYNGGALITEVCLDCDVEISHTYIPPKTDYDEEWPF